MEFPKITHADSQGRIGIDTLAVNLTRMGLIWRETSRADVGIDGQIEYVDNQGRATAKIVAAQVKSGESYFADPFEDGWRIYPEKKHLFYWERFPMPVLLILHSPNRNELFWSDARQQLRAGAGRIAIIVPNKNILTPSARDRLFINTGVNNIPFIEDIQSLLKTMATTKSQNAGFYLSYLELFVNGLTNIVRSLYFGMDLAITLAENYLEKVESEFGVGLGSDEYDFLYEYIQFLVAQHLADVDFSDCLIDWLDRRMVPRFMVPLTSRGRQVVEAISHLEDQFRSSGLLTSIQHVRVAQEGLVQMVFTDYAYERFSLIADFQKLLLNKSL